MNSLGEKIKKLRKKNGMTQSELAEKLGLTKSNISKYENGIVDPGINGLKMIGSIFNVSTDYLLGVVHSEKTVDYYSADIDEELPEEAQRELENFKDYLKNKYLK